MAESWDDANFNSGERSSSDLVHPPELCLTDETTLSMGDIDIEFDQVKGALSLPDQMNPKTHSTAPSRILLSYPCVGVGRALLAGDAS